MFMRKITLVMLAVIGSQFISPAYTTEVIRAPVEPVELVGEAAVARAAVVKAEPVVEDPHVLGARSTSK